MPRPPFNQESDVSLLARVTHLEKAVNEDSVLEGLATKIVDQVLEKLPMKLQPLLYDVKHPKTISATPPLAKPMTPPKVKAASELTQTSNEVSIDTAPEKKVDVDTRKTKTPDAGIQADQRKKAKDKLTMACDHDVDTSAMRLQEESHLGAIFTTVSNPAKPMFRVEHFYYDKGFCQALARSSHFANITLLVVVANAVYLGIDTDHNHAANIYDADWGFQVASQSFCFYFAFELGVRFFAFANKLDCLCDGWFKFDLFLVATMVLDVWVLMPILKFVAKGGDLPVPTQPLRMLRLFKLTRMARLMRAFPELVTLIKGLVRSLRAIASSLVLIGLMVYTWAILIHTVLRDEKEFNELIYKDYQYDFTRLGDCIWTLLMAGTLMLDNTAPLLETLILNDKNDKKIVGLMFMAYCVLTALCVLQMVIGVLCDVVSQVGEERKDADTIGLIRQELLEDIFALTGGEDRISSKQFDQVLDGERSKALLKKLNINRMFLQQAAALMFPDEKTKVPVRAVLELMIMCRGDNIATVQVLASALCFITNELNDMQDQILTDVGGVIPEQAARELHQHVQQHVTRSLLDKHHLSDSFADCF